VETAGERKIVTPVSSVLTSEFIYFDIKSVPAGS
jgi:hypothetical protein